MKAQLHKKKDFPKFTWLFFSLYFSIRSIPFNFSLKKLSLLQVSFSWKNMFVLVATAVKPALLVNVLPPSLFLLFLSSLLSFPPSCLCSFPPSSLLLFFASSLLNFLYFYIIIIAFYLLFLCPCFHVVFFCHYKDGFILKLINRPGVAGAVLQSPLSLIH